MVLFVMYFLQACVTVRLRKESVHSDGADTDSNSLNECYDNDFGSSEETSEGRCIDLYVTSMYIYFLI